ncbi:ferritin family protein [Desulfuromonas carbonis]|uniref:ferritin family protein n=1 Tax=Desulfuromonas sp. DDH964 TaxID=1823759 RepID=UPI00078D91FE|nr:ferritin family protein [Desulfuromonas sp. DDH964]AMV72168.1 ferritin-like domain-containing protein [Desulfuromonas sp. DDH964]
MTQSAQVCYTFEAALEMAVKMEQEGFRHYFEALRIVRDKAAQEILRDAALDELEHKFQLEKALIEGQLAGDALAAPVPTMNLDYVLEKKSLNADADGRQALAYAIHLEKSSLDFYRRMARGCSGAPMGDLFTRIANDESRHLQQLEDLYEKHFLTEN